MYVVDVEVKESNIHGMGVFAKDNIGKGTIVWQFTSGHDQRISKDEFDKLPDKAELVHVAYLSPASGQMVYPPKGDPACYTNHSPNNNLSTVFDMSVSVEPYFIANRDIKAGEELTNNYLEFDKISQTLKDRWLKS